jgi:predicted nucleotidyltransferase
MITPIAPEKLAVYRRTAQARWAREQQAVTSRRTAAWASARQAAQLLKAKFGATRVVAFGSLAHSAWFHARSDIDLAVAGVAPETFWQAWCALDELAADRFDFDLVAIETVAGRLRHEIDREGVEL